MADGVAVEMVVPKWLAVVTGMVAITAVVCGPLLDAEIGTDMYHGPALPPGVVPPERIAGAFVGLGLGAVVAFTLMGLVGKYGRTEARQVKA